MAPSIDQKKDCYIGIDIGDTYLNAGVINSDGRIWAQRHQDVPHENFAMLTQQIVATVSELRQADRSFPIKGVGIGVPGLISRRNSRIILSLNLPFLNGVEFKGQVEELIGLPVVLENDANMAAYAEMLIGAALGVSHFIYVAIGSRVGAAIILDRKVYQGFSGFAGELGHVSVDPDGKKCYCGGTGCLERYVSAPSIAQRVEERISLNPSSALQIITDRPVSAQDVSAAAMIGDKMASVIISDVGRYLGMTIANSINFLNVEMVVLGGSVIDAGEVLLRPTIDEVKRRALSPPYDDCKIVAGSLGTSAGVIGASLMARDILTAGIES
jgi:glucokinase-like ROK family protein